MDRWIDLGRCGRPFGVQGWLHVESFTDPPERLLEYPVWVLGRQSDARAYRVAGGRAHGSGLVVCLEGVGTREEAARLAGSGICVRREELPPVGPREHYRADLLGLEVRNAEGALLGRLDHFIDTPANAVMVVKGEREYWIPVSPRHLLQVERDLGRIRVDWPEDF